MTKIRAEIDVIDSNYCENEDTTCPMCLVGDWGQYYCALFDNVLEMDEKNHHYCKRCEKCKQADKEQVKKMTKEEVKKGLVLCLNGCCYGCPYDDIKRCRAALSEDVLQLIDEQKAEIERLQKKLAPVLMRVKDTNGGIDVEKLQKQAVKEFAEKLKARLKLGLYEWQHAQVDSKTIDDLLKEYEKCDK